MTGDSPLEITPQTRIGALLAAYPELEVELLKLSSVFSRLKNPVLRRTVGNVATLAQAAAMARMSPVVLVNELRSRVGMGPLGDDGSAVPAGAAAAGAPAAGAPAAGAAAGTPPEWFDATRIAARLDADAYLDRGEHPISEAYRLASTLPAGGILAIKSAFVPVPLIENLGRTGYESWTEPKAEGAFLTYVRRMPPRAAPGQEPS